MDKQEWNKQAHGYYLSMAENGDAFALSGVFEDIDKSVSKVEVVFCYDDGSKKTVETFNRPVTMDQINEAYKK